MFEPGDYVVNATNGVCQIAETLEMDLLDDGNAKPYFLLVPVGESTARVYIPVDTAETRIRRAITKEEAMKVIDRIPSIEEIRIDREKEREAKYKAAVRSCDPIQLFGIMKTLYRRRNERIAQGKKSTAIDERYFKMAENQIYAELAFALGCQKGDMEEVIMDRLQTAV